MAKREGTGRDDAGRDGFGAHVQEQLQPLGAVSIRRMFGGAGVFLDGVMFALIIDDVLFFKTDDGNRCDFEAEGLGPFTYEKKTGQATVMSYWRAPDRLLDDDEELRQWAGKAIAVARRAQVKSGKKRPAKAQIEAGASAELNQKPKSGTKSGPRSRVRA